MKEYCVDLEIAKELKVNGFSQNTHYGYTKHNTFDCITFEEKNILINRPIQKDVYYAPISDEILKELPKYFKEKNQYYLLKIEKEFYNIKSNKTFFEVSYNGYKYICIEDDKLSNALAKMWLFLKKEGYIK